MLPSVSRRSGPNIYWTLLGVWISIWSSNFRLLIRIMTSCLLGVVMSSKFKDKAVIQENYELIQVERISKLFIDYINGCAD